MFKRALVLVCPLLLALSTGAPVALAQDETAAEETKKETKELAEPLKFESSHRLQSGGTDIGYTVTAEEIYLRDAEGEPTYPLNVPYPADIELTAAKPEGERGK